MHNNVTFKHIECNKMSELEIQETSRLFSENYGVWSNADPIESKRGKNVKFPKEKILNEFVIKPNRFVIMAYIDNELAGHIFYLKRKGHKTKPIIFVLQLVVAKKYRNQKIASRMMKSIWQLSNCYAWGLFTSNPMTIKVLETVTLRKVDEKLISKKLDKIKDVVYDIFPEMDWIEKYENGTVSTDFYVDHSDLKNRIEKTYGKDAFPFSRELPEGKEWLAITFASQKPSFTSVEEWEEYMKYSQTDIMTAYSNMKMENHAWTKHTKEEVDYLIEKYINQDDYILDFGCGYGRHTLELNARGFKVLGIDFSNKKISQAQEKIDKDIFICDDIRSYHSKQKVDKVLCLYDVIGSFPNEKDNIKILKSAYNSLKPKGKIILSVMNMNLTKRNCKNIVSDISNNIDKLLDLPSSNTMQETGDVFDGKKILIDNSTGIIYRKEQFTPEDSLPCELIVRDRRYTLSGIQKMLNKSGFVVDEVFYFQAGRLNKPLSNNNPKAKEIFVVAHKPNFLRRLFLKCLPFPEGWKD